MLKGYSGAAVESVRDCGRGVAFCGVGGGSATESFDLEVLGGG